MLPEGLLVPWGWTLFPETPAGSTPEGNEPRLNFSKYDFLLAQSQHVNYAKVLDLYFVDDTAVDGEYYDYKVTTIWPESNLRRLDHELTFDVFEPGHVFFPISELDEQVVIVNDQDLLVEDEPEDIARTEKALLVENNAGFTLFNFIKPVTEIQLYLVNPDYPSTQPEIVIEAYRNFRSAPVDVEKLSTEKGSMLPGFPFAGFIMIMNLILKANRSILSVELPRRTIILLKPRKRYR